MEDQKQETAVEQPPFQSALTLSVEERARIKRMPAAYKGRKRCEQCQGVTTWVMYFEPGHGTVYGCWHNARSILMTPR